MKKEIGVSFIFLALLSLLAGVAFGCFSAFQFVFPGFTDVIPFVKTRPLHVSLVVAWIFLSAVGGIYHYLPGHCKLPLYSTKFPKIHFFIFLLTGLTILGCYFAGKFGGREYWEFPAILAIPILISWVLFGYNYFRTVKLAVGKWPVYYWMWGTGIFFFLFTFSESYLWIFPYFRNSLTRDLTVQWKAYGALVGSWNMLVYGTAMFLMEKTRGDDKSSESSTSFLLYLLGLINLMFGWAHHIYIVPAAPWIRYLAYAISMSELILLAKIIWTWKSTLSESRRNFHILTYRFLVAADFWILINLVVALLISIPAVNLFTHGTHITVAHAMGSTIGINTMILLGSCFFLCGDILSGFTNQEQRIIHIGYWLLNSFLLVFFSALLFAGATKAKMLLEGGRDFHIITRAISPSLLIFAIAGLGIFSGIGFITYPAIRKMARYLLIRQPS